MHPVLLEYLLEAKLRDYQAEWRKTALLAELHRATERKTWERISRPPAHRAFRWIFNR